MLLHPDKAAPLSKSGRSQGVADLVGSGVCDLRMYKLRKQFLQIRIRDACLL